MRLTVRMGEIALVALLGLCLGCHPSRGSASPDLATAIARISPRNGFYRDDQATIRKAGFSAVRPLATALRSADSIERVFALANQLVTIDQKAAAGEFLRLMQALDPEVRRIGVISCSSLPQELIPREAMLKAATDPDQRVRLLALSGLGFGILDRPAARVLSTSLSLGGLDALAAASAFARHKDRRGLAVLHKWLRSGNTNEREAAIFGIEGLDGATIVRELKPYIKDRDPRIRALVEETLRRVKARDDGPTHRTRM